MAKTARPDHAIKVLVINPDFYRSSGVTVAIRRLYEAMPGERVTYRFVSCLMPNAAAQKEEDLGWLPGAEVERLPLMSRNPLKVVGALFRLRRMLRRGNIDVLHIHHRRLALICGWLARHCGVPVVYTGHLVYGDAGWFRRAHFDAAVAITKTIADEIRAQHPGADVRVISNIAPPGCHAAPPEKGLVTCVARLDQVKNHRTLLEAWARMGAQPGARLQLLGEGPLRRELVELAAELQISETVDFCGFVEDAPRRIAQSAFLVLSSYVEGQPMVILEGAMSGRPSLVSNVPGSRDTVPKERLLPNLFDPDDPVELADMLRAWLANHEMVQAEGQNFRNYAEAISAAGVVASAHAEFYRHLRIS